MRKKPTQKIKTLKELKSKLAVLGKLDPETKKNIVCSLIGHSRIQTVCFGYYNCGHCGAQVGDTLASIYDEAKEAVVVGHNCLICRKNMKKCTWRDTFMAPDPFVKE